MVVIIVILIVMLVVAAIAINALQQQKEKQESERKRNVAKQKAILEETEELLMNAGALPMSKSLTVLLQKRTFNALQALKQLMPDSLDVKQRLEKMQEIIKNPASEEGGREDNFTLPENDQQLIGILQGVKKLRAVLRSEQSKSTISPDMFRNEDLRLEMVQLKISVESMVKRGNAARANEMIGSARQYYEKALATLSNQPHSNDYTKSKIAEINSALTDISSELKSSNDQERKKKEKDEEDDLDVLFQPKKKW